MMDAMLFRQRQVLSQSSLQLQQGFGQTTSKAESTDEVTELRKAVRHLSTALAELRALVASRCVMQDGMGRLSLPNPLKLTVEAGDVTLNMDAERVVMAQRHGARIEFRRDGIYASSVDFSLRNSGSVTVQQSVQCHEMWVEGGYSTKGNIGADKCAFVSGAPCRMGSLQANSFNAQTVYAKLVQANTVNGKSYKPGAGNVF